MLVSTLRGRPKVASGSRDEDEEEAEVSMGDEIEVRVVDGTDGAADGCGGRGAGKRTGRAEWVAAEGTRTFRGGSFEAQPKGGVEDMPKLKCGLSDVGRTWRKIVG